MAAVVSLLSLSLPPLLSSLPSLASSPMQEFVEVESWAHIDIAGVMQSGGELPFLSKGMTGRNRPDQNYAHLEH